MKYVNESLPLPVSKVVWFGQRYAASLNAQFPNKSLPYSSCVESREGGVTSPACVVLLHLLPVVFGWVGLEPKLTYHFSRHIHSTRARGLCLQ